MKALFTFLLSGLYVVASQAQSLTKDLDSFDKIVSSPLIDVVLIKGEKENIRIEYENITPDKINIKTKGKTLQVYLTDAKISTSKKDGNWKETSYWYTLYPGAKLKAYITYQHLKEIQVRGEQRLVCDNVIESKKLKIRMMGENKAELAGLKVDRLTVALFGENRVDVAAGTAGFQKYRMFGENKVYAENLLGEKIHTSMFGESLLDLHASEKLNVNSFGESTVLNSGAGDMHKKITLGDNTVRRK